MKTKKILCPVDGSKTATNAVEYAGELAKIKSAEVVLLEVVEVPTIQDVLKAETGADQQIKQLEDEAMEGLKSYCNVVKEQFGVNCTAKVRSAGSNVDTEIKNEVEDGAYDLIVMGTNGADDVRQFLFGTHTYNVFKKVKCPLIMVPVEHTFDGFKQWVYATDYKAEDIEIVKELTDFSEDIKPKLTFLHISEKDNEISEEVYHSFKDVFEEELNVARIDFERVVGDDVLTGINEYMIKSNADLLVLMTREYGFIERLFHESTTKSISQVASYPVFIYHG